MQQFNTAHLGFEAPKFQRLQLVQFYPWRSPTAVGYAIAVLKAAHQFLVTKPDLEQFSAGLIESAASPSSSGDSKALLK
ncbi:hypothetical protein [Nostoc sp.]|uniref:hypothetical protein n=1 Tax=Nostoc sp. TaxID=1180 RepID=UPI0035940E33